MPIINNNGDVYVEYQIPTEIDEKIPDYFYSAMLGELVSIHGPIIYAKWQNYQEDDEGNEILDDSGNPIIESEYYNLDSGTGAWFNAFFMTCYKLDLLWLFEYYRDLKWYDSDTFDGIIENRIIKNVIEVEENNANSYYKHLCHLYDKEIEKKKKGSL